MDWGTVNRVLFFLVSQDELALKMTALLIGFPVVLGPGKYPKK